MSLKDDDFTQLAGVEKEKRSDEFYENLVKSMIEAYNMANQKVKEAEI